MMAKDLRKLAALARASAEANRIFARAVKDGSDGAQAAFEGFEEAADSLLHAFDDFARLYPVALAGVLEKAAREATNA